MEERLAFAREFSDVETLDFTSVDDPVPALRERTASRGPGVCIDAVGVEGDGSRMHEVLGRALRLEAGSPVAAEWAVHAVRKAGTVVLIGVYGPPWNLFPLGTAMNKGLTLRMAQCNTKRYVPRLLEHVREGRVHPARIISHRLPLSEVGDGYRMFAEKTDSCRKVVMTPGEDGAPAKA